MFDPPLPYDLAGHVAIVTGANHGIGEATARGLAACGAQVLVSYLRQIDSPDPVLPPATLPPPLPEAYRVNRARGADHVIEAIRADGGEAIALEADLSDPETPARLFDAAEEALGPVDILVNNASAWVADTFAPEQPDPRSLGHNPVSAESADRIYAVDARAGALLIGELASRSRARGANWGRIVGLISGGPEGFPTEVSYGAAKAALTNYTMSAAWELASLGITANLLYPPVTDTGWVDAAVREIVEQKRELIHIAPPEDVARTIAYLCSDEARLITANIVHLR